MSGIRHAVEIEADSLYEAVVLGVQAFREHNCDPGTVRPIDVEMRKSITHTLTLSRVQQWLEGACKSPREKVTKERLKAPALIFSRAALPSFDFYLSIAS
jgi:hypothetical protein